MRQPMVLLEHVDGRTCAATVLAQYVWTAAGVPRPVRDGPGYAVERARGAHELRPVDHLQATSGTTRHV
jgi:hypothetical protein